MSFGRIFGPTFFSVLAALVLYDLVGKGLIAKVGLNTYDDTFNPEGKQSEYFIGEDGKVYRIKGKEVA